MAAIIIARYLTDNVRQPVLYEMNNNAGIENFTK